MILHFLTDDKFSDYVIEQFSDPELHSEFVLISSSVVGEYFQSVESVWRVNPYKKKELRQLIDAIGNYSAIVLHGLFYPWCEMVLRNVPDNVKVAWVFWGGEIYGRKDLMVSFLSKGSKLLLGLHGMKRRKNNDIGHYELPMALFQRIDYCLTDVHEDFEFVKAYSGFEAKELWYNYYSVDETLGELRMQSTDGKNIIVGNSCTIENNLLDGLRAIKGKVDCNSKIFVPLSYGEPWLRRIVIKVGKCMFGKQFYPLVEFMPRDDYNNIIKSCSVAIMPHYRPQAFGNILTALWLGTRVYMSEKSLLYKFFKRIGAIVFSIEKDLYSTSNLMLHPLTDEERNVNQEVITGLYDKSVMNVKIRELVSTLNG